MPTLALTLTQTLTLTLTLPLTLPLTLTLTRCGHGGLCMKCAELCTKKRPPVCPMCRARIVKVLQVGDPNEQGIVDVHVPEPANSQ